MPRRPVAGSRHSAARWRAVYRGGRRVRWRPGMRRVQQLLQRASATAQVVVSVLVILTALLAVNWLYQVARKPSELFFPVAGTLNKSPLETWRAYGAAFERFSTGLISPELLAALAQVEAAGNPIARTYWRWSYTSDPFSLYRPASTAVGMYQLTDGTFAAARRWCIRDHQVIAAGAWDDWHSCWFNSLYARVIPSHAIELTAAYLDRAVTAILQRHGLSALSPREQQELAAVIHLCGAGAAEKFARHHFRLSAGQRCGEHEVRVYVNRVDTLVTVFRRLAVSEEVR